MRIWIRVSIMGSGVEQGFYGCRFTGFTCLRFRVYDLGVSIMGSGLVVL